MAGWIGDRRRVGALLAVALVVTGCARGPQVRRETEGDPMVGTPGARLEADAPTGIVLGSPLHQLALVVPAGEPAWRVAWAQGPRAGSSTVGSGAASGLLTGLGIISSTPVLVLAWPAALGIVAGATTLGAISQGAGGPSPSSDSQDRRTVQEVLAKANPERVFLESLIDHLRQQRGVTVIPIRGDPVGRPEVPPADLVAAAATVGADAFGEATVEGFGLAVGESPETLGVFVRVRLRIREARGGRLRYDRVLQHGPGKRLEGMPASSGYTLGFLALDDGIVLKNELSTVVRLLGKVVAEDPKLPLATPGP